MSAKLPPRWPLWPQPSQGPRRTQEHNLGLPGEWRRREPNSLNCHHAGARSQEPEATAQPSPSQACASGLLGCVPSPRTKRGELIKRDKKQGLVFSLFLSSTWSCLRTWLHLLLQGEHSLRESWVLSGTIFKMTTPSPTFTSSGLTDSLLNKSSSKFKNVF